MSKRHMFYWQQLASLFQVQEKLRACRNSHSHKKQICIFEILSIYQKIILRKYLKSALICSSAQINFGLPYLSKKTDLTLP